MNSLAELARRLENMIRTGTIADVDLAAEPVALCRVQTGGLLTDWLPWLSPRAGNTREWNPPTVGEQAIVFCPSGEPASGLVLTGLNSRSFPAPSHSEFEHLTIYPDGARVCYNHSSSALEVTGIKTAMVEASELVTVDCPKTHVTGNVTIDGDTLIKGTLTVEKLLTYMAGMAGSNGLAGKTKINGDIEHEGGQLSSNGVVVDSHLHDNVQQGHDKSEVPVK